MDTHEPTDPVRVCCGYRHRGAQCPDGLVMCCYCFDLVRIDQLAEEDGVKIDVCQACRAVDLAELRREAEQ